MSCHGAYAEDALNAYKMNAKPGGKQPKMRDTVWEGRPQSMVFSIYVPEGLIQVLKEHFLNNKGYACVFLPKFHCELNPIERVWAQAKRYTRAYCDYSVVGLRRNVPLALDTVTLDNIRNHYRKV